MSTFRIKRVCRGGNCCKFSKNCCFYSMNAPIWPWILTENLKFWSKYYEFRETDSVQLISNFFYIWIHPKLNFNRWLTRTDTYWHILTRTDTYWHVLTRTDTYKHLQQHADNWRPTFAEWLNKTKMKWKKKYRN